MTSSSKGDEPSLTVSPCGYIEWRGPRATIEATGWIPANFKWPERIDYAQWHAHGFDYLLRRCRPNGFMGPMRGWTAYDYWFVRRSVPGHAGNVWRIHTPYQELGDILFGTTRLGEALRINFLGKAHASERIEKIEAMLVPRRKQRRQ